MRFLKTSFIKPVLKKTFLALVLLIILPFLIFPFVAQKHIFPDGATVTTSQKPVDLFFKGVHLRIPKAYLTKSRNWAGGTTNDPITLVAYWPEMTPIGEIPRNLRDDNPNRIHIWISSGGEESVSRFQAAIRGGMDALANNLQIQENGLALVNHAAAKNFSKEDLILSFSNWQEHYLYANSSTQEFAKLSCEPGAWGCTVSANFSSNLSGTYVANAELIQSEWPTLNQKVAQLIGSFMQTNTDGEK